MLTKLIVLLIVIQWMSYECNANQRLNTDEKAAAVYMADLNRRNNEIKWKSKVANFNYDSDINDKHLEEKTKMIKVENNFKREQAIETKKFDWTHFDPHLRRQFEKYAITGVAALGADDEKKLIDIGNRMEKIYSTGKICGQITGNNDSCKLELDPDLYKIYRESKNFDELKDIWVNWRNATGKQMRKDFIDYINLSNKAAKLNVLPNKKFNTFDELWLEDWETPDIKIITENLLKELMPFYKKLHLYVRKHLAKAYPGKMPKDNTIPAHLLGNMWAQHWSNIMQTVPGVDPYPNVTNIDITQELKNKNYTAKKMFVLADKFFGDLGLEKVNDKFWINSIIEKSKDKEMVCHASAFDFFANTSDDYRIRMCTNINMGDLITIHHELGHIQYYMSYSNQPGVYRVAANPGFNEAIGDLLALSVSTPKHLQKIGLLKLDKSIDLNKITIKYQLKMALDKLTVLPWAFVVDKWRWDVFSGQTDLANINKHWWKLRGKWQGLSPPVKRSEEDMDAGAKYHIPFAVEYIRYFVAHILQFQFHKSLCSFSQKNVSLHECDIDGDKEAGALLKKVLSIGSSELWPKQLKMLTGSERMDVQPLLEYFKPLQQFLDNELKGEDTNWQFNVEDYFDNLHTIEDKKILIITK